MDKKERLEALIAYYSHGKPSVFAKYIGVAPSTISSWFSRNTFDYDLLFAKCESISAKWLLTGNGEMLKSETAENTNNNDTISQLLAMIREKDATIQKQATEIGSLRERLTQMQDAVSSATVQDARVG